jgi:hypothetical protein
VLGNCNEFKTDFRDTDVNIFMTGFFLLIDIMKYLPGIQAGVRNFSFPQYVQTGCGAHPASYSMETGVFPPRVKREGRFVDYSPLSSAEVRNDWSYTSAPAYSFMVWTGAIVPFTAVIPEGLL